MTLFIASSHLRSHCPSSQRAAPRKVLRKVRPFEQVAQELAGSWPKAWTRILRCPRTVSPGLWCSRSSTLSKQASPSAAPHSHSEKTKSGLDLQINVLALTYTTCLDRTFPRLKGTPPNLGTLPPRGQAGSRSIVRKERRQRRSQNTHSSLYLLSSRLQSIPDCKVKIPAALPVETGLLMSLKKSILCPSIFKHMGA